MTSPVQTVDLSKTQEGRVRKGLFNSEKRSVEVCQCIKCAINHPDEMKG